MQYPSSWPSLISLAVSVIAFSVSGCSRTEEIFTIAAASNMQFATEELTQAFTQSTGIPCNTVFSSSGKLTAQIKSGAPFDILLSANLKYPNSLYQAQLTYEKPKIYAYGILVLWTMKQHINLSMESLLNKPIHHIGVANPKTAPYGVATLESLKYFKIDQQVNEKLIYGENVAQVNQFIKTQAVDMGFTSKSVIVSSPLANQGQWIEVDPNSYSPIAQGMAILKNDRNQLNHARQFQAFLLSEKGLAILQNHGYNLTQP